MLQNKRILVTGGTGFLGQHLVRALCDHGVPTQDISVPSSAEYDLRKHDEVERLFTNSKYDVVFHLATVAGGIELMQERPAEVFRDNLLMHTFAMDAARRHGVQKFIAVGSALIYPEGAPMPLREEDIWNGQPHPTTRCFGLPGRMLLAQAQMSRKQSGFNAIYLVLCNLYGPGDHFFTRHPHVIPAMIKKFDGANAVTLFGTGDAAREFLHVRDAARALIDAAEKYDGEEPLNIGSGIVTPLRELAGIIAKESGFKGAINWDTTKPEGEKRRCIDSSRAKKMLSFTPTIALEDGLRETIAWYREEKHRRGGK